MKQAIINCLFLLSSIFAKAQLNLVPDPSFEDTTGIVDGWGTTSLKQWHNLDSTKNYCAPFAYLSYITQAPPYSLPNSQWCSQNSLHGGGVVAFDFFWTNNPTYKRSLARTKLKGYLIAGKTYCAKMYVNASDKYYGYFTDGIAMYFDNGQLDTIATIWHDTSGVYTFVTPQVSNPTGNVLNDTVNWMPVSGTFVATGTERFLTIGNFKTDAATTKVFNPSTFVFPDTVQASALLIDDISVIPIDAANWLHDTSCILGDSVYIGLLGYEVPDGMWYDINMNYIGKGSGIKVKPIQWATKYIQQIDLCGIIRSDTLTVWAAPDGIGQFDIEANRKLEVYPNPSKDKIFIHSNSGEDKEIYNFIGQLIFSTKANEIDVSKYSKGVYYLKCGVEVKKIIVN